MGTMGKLGACFVFVDRRIYILATLPSWLLQSAGLLCLPVEAATPAHSPHPVELDFRSHQWHSLWQLVNTECATVTSLSKHAISWVRRGSPMHPPPTPQDGWLGQGVPAPPVGMHSMFWRLARALCLCSLAQHPSRGTSSPWCVKRESCGFFPPSKGGRAKPRKGWLRK